MPEQTEPSPLDIMFDESEPEVVQDAEEVVEEVEEQEEEESEEVEETPEEESEEDYEAELPEKKEEEPEEEEEPKNESHARKRAKEEGRRRKALEAEKKEWEIERDRLTSELEQQKTKLSEFETTRIKPEDHEDYKALIKDIRETVENKLEDFDAPGAKKISESLGDFVTKYRVGKEAKKLDEFKADLCKELFDDREIEELDKDEKRELKDAVALIRESTAKADKLTELHNDLEKRSKNGTLAVGLREYETTTKEYQPILDSIGDLPDDVVEDNPNTVESVVARIAKSPEGKKRVENAKKDVVEILFGQRPLTQAEIDKYEANGGSYKELLATRQKSLNEKRKKLLPMLVQGLVGRAEFKKALSELAELRGKKESEESEDDALRKITKKKVTKVKEETPKNPVDIMFDD